MLENPWVQYANYERAEAPKDEILNIDEISMKALEEYVSQGVLNAEDIYEAESKSAHPRESVLRKYKPKAEKEDK